MSANKTKAFDDYKRANYLSDYRFFISRYPSGRSLLVTAGSVNHSCIKREYDEIRSTRTLAGYINRIKYFNATIIFIDGCSKQQSLTIDELKEQTLLHKLAGL